MTLRMADGVNPNNLPPGMDAYAGYTDGRWPDYNTIVANTPNAKHLSIDATGTVHADCADVENGDLTSWKGYTVGYASISKVQGLINADGRPTKLWTAHYTNVAHICNMTCGFGFTGTADGTQWTDHNGAWDESLLLDNFFDFQTPPPPPPKPQPTGVCIVNLPILQQGANGNSVQALQKLLGGIAVDGVFGPITHQAVINFQRANGLTRDGLVGTHTWGALLGEPQ